MTIRRKLITIQLVTAAIVLVLASTVFVWSDLTTYRASLVSRLGAYAELIGDNTISSLEFVDPGAAAEILASLSVAEGITHACIYDASGSIFATYSRVQQSDGAFPDIPGEGHVFSEDSLELYFPIRREGELISTVFVRSNLEAFTEKTAEFAINAVLVLVVGLGLSFVLSVILQRTLSGRIEVLSDAAREVSESGRYDRRVPIEGTDELGVLSAGFNEMLSQIQLRDGELREARDTLEERVQERTEELESTRNEALLLAQEADAANRSKSVFLANVSHEIRTPMNAITGFAEILNGQITDPQQKQYIEAIKTSGDSLLTLFGNILDLSKMEAGDLDLNGTDVDLLMVFTNIENIFGPRATAKGLAFQLKLDPELPRSVALDEKRFFQILHNLLDNAVKFTKLGNISVEAKTVITHNKVALCIDISDTGIGIPEDQIEKVFAPFTQSQDQSINEYGGTGLGLTLTKRLLDAMGGRVSVTSQVYVGSTFHVVLDDVNVVDNTPIGDQTSPTPSDVSSGDFEAESATPTEVLTDAIRARLPDLLVEMAGRESDAANLAETLTINDVEDFAAWLKGLADTSELSLLAQWADGLAQQTSMFEMENMADTLKSYPALLEEIRSLI
ncbi:MAG: signal transduction histidine kinase [Candidatus Latescibacterota bacterium]|jgi:signal transduction histidine kinase